MSRSRQRRILAFSTGVFILVVMVAGVVNLSATEIEPSQCEFEEPGTARFGCCQDERVQCMRNCNGNPNCQNHCSSDFNGCMGKPMVPL